MSIQYISATWLIKGLTPATRLVLISLADRANTEGTCFPSIENIAERCELGRSTVISAINLLEKRGYVRRVKRGKVGISTTYELLFSPTSSKSNATSKHGDVDQSADVASLEFKKFWRAYAETGSKRMYAESECRNIWKSMGCDGHIAHILKHIEWTAKSGQWDDVKYIPSPRSYLLKQPWDGWECPAQARNNTDDHHDDSMEILQWKSGKF